MLISPDNWRGSPAAGGGALGSLTSPLLAQIVEDYWRRGEFSAALDFFEEAIPRIYRDERSAAIARVHCALWRGDVASGFARHRNNLALLDPRPPNIAKRRWDGRPLTDTRLLVTDDKTGYGDVVLFLRFLPWAASRCRKIVMAARAPLHPLIWQFSKIKVVAEKLAPSLPATVWCRPVDFPGLAQCQIDTIPPTPYLRADPERTAWWGEWLADRVPGGLRRIGLVWAAKPVPAGRAISFGTLAPLFDLRDVAFISLQMGDERNDISTYSGRAPLIDAGGGIRDFGDTAALINHCDVVITVDGVVANLAGAMARPAWVMVPYYPEWRWGLEGDTTPWYRSARIYRPPGEGHWRSVIAAVAKDLRNGFVKT